MPIVFGAIVPHPPLVIPTIGQENKQKLRKTKKALQFLAAELYHAKPDVVIVISPHGDLIENAFTINHSPVLKVNFEKFGDFSSNQEYKNEMGLGYQIKEFLETKFPLILTNDQQLDFGSAVPLHYLLANLKKTPIIPIGYCGLSNQRHFEFGQSLRQLIEQTTKRVAIVASGDLSHRINKKSPAGFSPRGQEFDNKVKEFLSAKDYQSILNLDPALTQEAAECGLRSILILLGIFEQINYEFNIISYESPLGVGYLAANLIIS